MSSPICIYPRSRRRALPPSSRSRLSSTTCSSLPSSSTNRRCHAFVPLVIFTALLSLRDRTLINQRNSVDAQSELSPLVTCLVVEVPAVGDKQTLGDTKGIYSQGLIAFQPGMRGTREKLQRLPMHMTMVQEDCGCCAIVGLFYVRQLFFATFDP
ncbi:hypothetical protein M405DRAFT_883813 [Rhizopogon salebrosus TDB-379]|nr:hypothetical protein M405DRAFT_883813 [Rhizopogon salebrosus TDB-379]